MTNVEIFGVMKMAYKKLSYMYAQYKTLLLMSKKQNGPTECRQRET